MWYHTYIRFAILILGFLAAPTLHVHAQDLSRTEQIDARMDALREEGHFPGAAVAVMRDGKSVHVGTYGFADLAHQVPVSERTVFETASLTKQMTALAVMTLVEEGRLSLDGRLVEWVENAPAAWAGITVNQLLSHTAGLAHHFERTVDGVHLLEYSRADMLSSAMSTPMVAEPGTDWEYSDQGYFLLGVIIEGCHWKGVRGVHAVNVLWPAGYGPNPLIGPKANRAAPCAGLRLAGWVPATEPASLAIPPDVTFRSDVLASRHDALGSRALESAGRQSRRTQGNMGNSA